MEAIFATLDSTNLDLCSTYSFIGRSCHLDNCFKYSLAVYVLLIRWCFTVVVDGAWDQGSCERCGLAMATGLLKVTSVVFTSLMCGSSLCLIQFHWHPSFASESQDIDGVYIVGLFSLGSNISSDFLDLVASRLVAWEVGLSLSVSSPLPFRLYSVCLSNWCSVLLHPLTHVLMVEVTAASEGSCPSVVAATVIYCGGVTH